MLEHTWLKQLKQLAEQVEIFMFEAIPNNYQPAPPDGWFAMRSNKRRIFMQMDSGKIPTPDEIQARLNQGEFNLVDNNIASNNKGVSIRVNV